MGYVASSFVRSPRETRRSGAPDAFSLLGISGSKYRIVRRIKLKRAGWPTLPRYSGPSPQVQSGISTFQPRTSLGSRVRAPSSRATRSQLIVGGAGAVMSCICPASQSDSLKLKLKLKLKSSLTLLGMFQDSLTGSKDC